jgi:hypothetical protein
MTEAPPSTGPPSTLDRATTKSGAATARQRLRLNPRAVIAGAIFLAVIGLAIWYLARPEPLLVQGEVESTRIDIAARVAGLATFRRKKPFSDDPATKLGARTRRQVAADEL